MAALLCIFFLVFLQEFGFSVCIFNHQFSYPLNVLSRNKLMHDNVLSIFDLTGGKILPGKNILKLAGLGISHPDHKLRPAYNFDDFRIFQRCLYRRGVSVPSRVPPKYLVTTQAV